MTVARRRLRLAVLAAVATTVLGGCAGLHPGAAAVVGSETITHQQVDEVARAVCSANIASGRMSGQPAAPLHSRGARETALTILLETELSHQFGRARGVEAPQRQVAQAVAASANGIAMLPAEQRADFRDALRGYAEGQFILIEAGRRALGQDVPEDEAIAEGRRQRAGFISSLDVEVDPRYGRYEDQRFKRGGTSLSVPASAEARAGARTQPGPAYIEALPPSQQCS